ncbi:PP2C family protein-serine/threonine phosphatase [Streptomyces sp. GC420]|uniref:PP2C family protein-serine/threonine phosphatase n=1 Tax=Streptomyces sp. GC420 TaxID=2697568 RepID=UPI001414E8FC|nr:PP2C family protein-serine/threonine phosphatase [Streptomyces sp. GC420]NBM19119.1 SpoIIE family protein phosphatase [Streptomyces sp. GC420]
MTGTEAMGRLLGDLLEYAHMTAVEELPALLESHAAAAGLGRARLFVADLREQGLRELTGRGPDAGEGGERFSVEGSLPGRAFRETRVLAGHGGGAGHRRQWVPVLDGTERLGVLRVDVPDGSPDADALAERLASLTGLLLVSKRPFSDSYARLVRTRPMGVAAEMQWKLMPPTAFANDRAVVAARMEPAYEVAGDAYDYAVAHDTLHLAVFDAMGHDSAAGLTANLAVAACRAQRRQDTDLVTVSQRIEEILIEQFGHSRYVTGVLADLDTRTGTLTWVNRGHHPPVLIRGGRWTTTLRSPPAHPMGTDLGLRVTLCREQLEPGDRLLFYTDGITEARDRDGRPFGLARFTDFVVRRHADARPVPEMLRRLMQAVLDHHSGRLDDDATVLFLEWKGNARNPALRPADGAPAGG